MKDNTDKQVLAVVGIDTGIGKSIATGMMARDLARKGVRVITQKMVQTGCEKISEDIMVHRKLMGTALLDADEKGLTCPYIFRHPASPHLAAEMEGKSINPDRIHDQTLELEEHHDVVLLEAAGGLMVPLTRQVMILDYISTHGLPVVLVTCARLGSINHTLLSLEALIQRQIPVRAVIYNSFPETDPVIAGDSITIIKAYLSRKAPDTFFVEMGKVDIENPACICFDGLILS